MRETEDASGAMVERSDAEWRELLGTEAWQVMRHHATERPGSHDHHPEGPGTYHCRGCGAELFEAAAKFDAHCGWPSFSQSKPGAQIGESFDTSHGIVRTEVHCARCGGHLGHLFPDGPRPTGLRYCINGVALSFVPDSQGVVEG